MSILQKLNHFRIPLEDIKQATNNFARENVIGQGSYGLVYKGQLLHSGGVVTVAVRPVDQRLGRVGENKFLNEISVLSSYKHKNIVSFVGFCDEGNEKILVQKFETRGSLDRYITSAKLKWLDRLQIGLGAACGLNYLHNGLEGQSTVLHRNVNSTTILLEENWQAKIGGLGNAMIGPMNNLMKKPVFLDGLITGAPGSVDPAYMQTGFATKESDVYSFGVVLFELLCGRLSNETYQDYQHFLGSLARLHYEKGKLDEIIDPILREQMTLDSLEAFSAIAYECLELDRSERPTMIQIVRRLEEVLGLQQEFEKALALQKVAQDLKVKQEEDYYKVKNLEHLKIPLTHIKSATHDFHDDLKIGHGGYGKVYRADLFHFDVQKYITEKTYLGMSTSELLGYQRRKSTVAVKRLDRRYGQGTAEFLQELSVFPYYRHQNLVTLVGFCDEDHECILVYEYASNGSLDKYIRQTDSKNHDTWALRLQICLDAARGLEYLHNGVGEHHRIIHRDIKSSNILLGQNWVGKISDFGLSRIGPANLQATFIMTQVAGTLEYVDPQYHKTGMLTKESDVYSFGVVLFEVLSGRLAYFQRSADDQEFLPHMAKRCFKQNKVNELIDPRLKKNFQKGSSTFNDELIPDSVSIFATLAYRCLQENRTDRPSMPYVLKELEKAFKSHVKGVEALRTSLETIRMATNDFSDIMEQGRYANVYRGELSHSMGHTAIIVKQLNPLVDSYANDFYKEITMLYSYSHQNVIPLIGFCEEENERIAVFQQMVNGSLKDHVKNSSLPWKRRLDICIDAAHGLAYIHSGTVAQSSIHGDIKSSSILLNHDWKAAISDFIIPKGVGTLGYYDPHYAATGILTQKSDVYSFGVVLFEVLCGRMAIETHKMDQQHPVHDVPDVEPEIHKRWANEDGQVIFLARSAARCFENNRLQEIVFPDIRGGICKKSLDTFSAIAYQCVQEQPTDRPKMEEVVKELEKALEYQDEWEWEQKLPRDYEDIIRLSNHKVSTSSTKKALHSLLSSGVLISKEKLWFSIRKDGVKTELVSATKFSYKNVKWRSTQTSRFSKVAKISDISNLNIQIQIKPQLLTPDIMYGVHLVFKFCNHRKVSSRPIYVNLKYIKAGETLNAYFAQWRAEGNWLTVELFRFQNNKESIDFDVLLESFSRYYCGNFGIFVEGVEFHAIDNVDGIKNKDSNHEKNVRLLKLEPEIDSMEQMVIDCQELINRAESNIQNASKEELYFLLLKGVLIDDGEKLFSLCKVTGKKCHMLPAEAVISFPSNVNSDNRKPKAQARFGKFLEIPRHHEFGIKCNVETQMLSSGTTYACFLVFKLSEKCRGLTCPVKVRDLVPYRKERTKIICFTTPSIVNLEKVKWIPKEREDGWMEVMVSEIISDMHDDKSIPMDIKVISYEGTMSGLIVYGIEFRPV